MCEKSLLLKTTSLHQSCVDSDDQPTPPELERDRKDLDIFQRMRVQKVVSSFQSISLAQPKSFEWQILQEGPTMRAIWSSVKMQVPNKKVSLFSSEDSNQSSKSTTPRRFPKQRRINSS